MRFVVFVSILSILMGLAAHADDFTFNPGNYSGENAYGVPRDPNRKDYFKLLRRGSEIRVIDVKNNIVYAFDINTPGEQQITGKLLEFLRNHPGSRVIGTLIDRMTISDIQVLSGNRLAANFNLYLKSTSVFGSVTAKLQIGAMATSSSCKITVYDNSSNNFVQKDFQGTCLTTESGTHMGVLALTTSLAPDLNNALGLITDLMVKLFSPMLSGLGNLYENR
jgi:hypothetical protein